MLSRDTRIKNTGSVVVVGGGFSGGKCCYFPKRLHRPSFESGGLPLTAEGLHDMYPRPNLN